MAKTDKKSRSTREPIDKTPVTTDPRFSSVHNDPRFNIPRRKDNKVVVDERFRPLLDDKDFAKKGSVDRYGRKVKNDAGRKAIEKFYTFEGEEDEDEEGSEDEEIATGNLEKGAKAREKERKQRPERTVVQFEANDEEDEEDTKAVYDPARGEGLVSSSEEESDEDDEAVDEEAVEELMDVQKDTDEIPLGDVTSRLAVVNLDWDHVRAMDLMATLISFVPAGGRVLKVSVYPSEFGKERMEREEMEGPPKDLFTPVAGSMSTTENEKRETGADKGRQRRKTEESDDEDEDMDVEVTAESIVKEDKGEEFDSAKLRKYQLERLRYFYAVIECDSPDTANNIYKECDGAEYEATANFFDLRFIPDDTTFDDHPRDECSEMPKNYKPNDFVTDALQHSKVKLTWDQDDQMRKQVSKEAFSRRDIEEMDLKAYLASSSESEDEDKKEAEKRRYRELLSLGSNDKVGRKDKKPVGDMEVTFTSALSENKSEGNVFEKEETTLEKYQRKEKERRQRRKDKFKGKKEGVANDDDDRSGSDVELKNGINVNSVIENAHEADGFNDPFFEQDQEPIRKSEKKKDRVQRKEEKIKEAAAQAAKRAELELLVQSDPNLRGDTDTLQHYNMKNIVKAEKMSKLKGKAAKRMSKKGVGEAEGLQDNYEIDVKDPRFEAIYERPEFAIDPTNPRFKKTKTMDRVLQEKRRRRENGELGRREHGQDEEEDEKRSRKKQKIGEGGKDLNSLVQSVKNKSKR